jgi:hypothetical protein
MTELFEESARRSPDRDTIRYFDKTISYGELYDIVDRFATPLATRKSRRVKNSCLHPKQPAVPRRPARRLEARRRRRTAKSNAKTKELDYHLNVSGAKLFVYLEDLRKLLARSDPTVPLQPTASSTSNSRPLPKIVS